MLEAEKIQQIGHTMTIPRKKEEVIRKFQVLFEDGLGAFPGSAHGEMKKCRQSNSRRSLNVRPGPGTSTFKPALGARKPLPALGRALHVAQPFTA